MDDFTALMLIGIFSLTLAWVFVFSPHWIYALAQMFRRGSERDKWK